MTKGRQLRSSDVAALARAGLDEVVVARLEASDVGEDEAAVRAARRLAGPGVVAGPARGGRVDLRARTHGVLVIDRTAVDRLNAIDESLTVATLPAYETVTENQIVATIKVIPLAVGEPAIAAWEAAAIPLEVRPFTRHRVSLVQTILAGANEALLSKTRDVTARRLDALGSTLVDEVRTEHRTLAVLQILARRAEAKDDVILLCGASSIIDRNDVIPAALVAAGGDIDWFGMPVFPGNLLLLGHIGAIKIVGLPGCARSPRLNGIDLVLRRLFAGLPVGATEIQSMGVGGLLGDPHRPGSATEWG
ncbi:molybdopterin-binding protein [Consotaella sp. CSK11QG-6]